MRLELRVPERGACSRVSAAVLKKIYIGSVGYRKKASGTFRDE